jgi:ElaB/YqjD/DUF883 family membrane-anchored ribosome-binding protein
VLTANAAPGPKVVVDQHIPGTIGGLRACIDTTCQTVQGVSDIHILGSIDVSDLTPSVTTGPAPDCTATINKAVTVKLMNGSGSLRLSVSYQPVDQNGQPVGPRVELAKVFADVAAELAQSHTVSVCATLKVPVPDVKPVVKEVKEVVEDTVDNASDVTEDTLDKASDLTEDTLDNASDVAEDAVDGVSEVAEDSLGEVGEAVNPTVHRTVKGVKNALDKTQDTVGDKVGDTSEFAGDVTDATQDVVSDKVGDVKHFTFDTVHQTAGIVSDKVGDTKEIVHDAAGDLKGTNAGAKACADATVVLSLGGASNSTCVSASVKP